MHHVCLTNFSAAALARYGVESTAPDVVDDVTLVGALMQRHGEGYTLGDADDQYLEAIITQGTREGIRFSKYLKTRVCNLRYQHDFLLAAQPTKLVGFCYVYYNPGGGNNHIDRRVYSQSMQAADDKAWQAAMLKTQAPWAFNIYATGEELPTEKIAKAPYQLVREGMNCAFKKMDMVVRPDLIGALRAA